MKYLTPIISSLALILFIYFLSVPIQAGESSLPPLGKFLNPFSGFWANADRVKSKDLEFSVNGIRAEVTIIKDERHVPHIFAENMSDMLFAQGYIIAQERLWQMDITTRAIEGKSSEILGSSALARDMGARRLGLPRSAKLAVETWKTNKEGMDYAKAFCDGVNYFIDNLSPSEYPLEFKLLDYEPQRWSPYRTALFIKAMAITLNSRQADVANSNALQLLGEDKYVSYYPEKNKKQSPIIQEKFWLDGFQSLNAEIDQFLEDIIPTKDRIGTEEFIGSNNFAISGSKSSSGNAILANDPHLKLTLPSIWLEMHLSCPEMNAYGVSLPAMPGITLGFNDNIAWGQTNAGHDVLDIYKVQWTDESKSQYLLDGQAKDTEIVIDKYTVKGEETHYDTVLYTQWGPIKKEDNISTDLAQHWVSNGAPSPEEIEIYLDINKAKDYEEFQDALKAFYAPAQNFIFSSKEGDIAMVLAGKLPIKEDQQGRFVQDGSKSTSAWKGFIPFEELPQELNPARAYVASANQHSTDDSYPYYYNGGFEDYRGRYINRKLEKINAAKKEDLMKLQLDATSLRAEEALPILLSNLEGSELSETEKRVYEALLGWDYVYKEESMPASYFEKWWSSFYKLTFDEIYEMREHNNVPFPEDFRLIELMEEDGGNDIFDISLTAMPETLKDVAIASFKKVRYDSLDIQPWSKERNTKINHLSNLPAFTSEEINSPGHYSTPNAISKYNGPSWRMVVEMSDPVKAYGIYPGGQSGNPGSIYYDNFVEDWADGEYYELNYSKNKNDITAHQVIKMKAE